MNELQTAKQIIFETLKEYNVTPEKIFLFGSRARKNFTKESDWDFYVIVKEELSIPQKRQITAMIRIRFAMEKIPIDVIIQSQSVVEKRKKRCGASGILCA